MDPKIHLQTKLLIDNNWVDSVSKKTFAAINPATGEVCEAPTLPPYAFYQVNRGISVEPY